METPLAIYVTQRYGCVPAAATKLIAAAYRRSGKRECWNTLNAAWKSRFAHFQFRFQDNHRLFGRRFACMRANGSSVALSPIPMAGCTTAVRWGRRISALRNLIENSKGDILEALQSKLVNRFQRAKTDGSIHRKQRRRAG